MANDLMVRRKGQYESLATSILYAGYIGGGQMILILREM